MEVFIIIQSVSTGSCTLAYYIIYCMNYLMGTKKVFLQMNAWCEPSQSSL